MFSFEINKYKINIEEYEEKMYRIYTTQNEIEYEAFDYFEPVGYQGITNIKKFINYEKQNILINIVNEKILLTIPFTFINKKYDICLRKKLNERNQVINSINTLNKKVIELKHKCNLFDRKISSLSNMSEISFIYSMDTSIEYMDYGNDLISNDINKEINDMFRVLVKEDKKFSEQFYKEPLLCLINQKNFHLKPNTMLYLLYKLNYNVVDFNFILNDKIDDTNIYQFLNFIEDNRSDILLQEHEAFKSVIFIFTINFSELNLCVLNTSDKLYMNNSSILSIKYINYHPIVLRLD